MAVDALFSISSLLLAVAIARSSAIHEFGAFGLAMVLYLFAIGLIRATVTDTTLSLPPTVENMHRGFQRVLLMSVVLGTAFLLAALLSASPFLTILGVTMPGLAALDYIRVTHSAIYRPMAAVRLASIWTACVLATGIGALLFPIAAPVVFTIWSGTGATIGVLAWHAARLPLLPRWRRNQSETRAAAWFSLDYIAGGGGSLLSTTLLGAVGGSSLIAALRGAGTLLGPVNLVSTTARSLALPYLSRARTKSPENELRAAVLIALVLVVVVVPPTTLILMVPSPVGVELLGATWWIAAPLLLPLAIESIAALAGSIASAGHRSQLAGARALTLRVSVGVIRPIVVVAAGVAYGAYGAAWAMAGISILNLFLWWASYVQLTRNNRAVV